MPTRARFCPSCGAPVYRRTYCNGACKQAAYRKRKKQQDEAKKRTIEIDAWLVQDRAVKVGGEKLDYSLGRFFNTYGKEAYTDLLYLLDEFMHVTGV